MDATVLKILFKKQLRLLLLTGVMYKAACMHGSVFVQTKLSPAHG